MYRLSYYFSVHLAIFKALKVKEMQKIFIYISLAISLIVSLNSCEKENVNPNDIPDNDSLLWFVDTLMNTWYYWYNENEYLNYKAYNDPVVFMEDLKVDKDKWSFIDLAKTVSAIFNEGKSFGFGFYLAWDAQYQLKVILSYNNTLAYEKGIRRGWILDKIDGVQVKEIASFDNFFSEDPLTMTFDFFNHKGDPVQLTLTKETFNQNAVFETATYSAGSKKVGYLSYKSFLGYGRKEVFKAVKDLKSMGIQELIVDLRFNTGGFVSLADTIANILVPADKENELFISTIHNNIVSDENDYEKHFEFHPDNLGLERIFFLTNNYSASASERVINGLAPHMDVFQIGDTTSGKPYSMYGWQYGEWLIYPVSAKSVNANGFGDFEDGLIPDLYIADNHAYDWGDPNDPLIKQALHYIEYGSFGEIALKLKSSKKSKLLKGTTHFNKGLQLENY